MNDVPDTKCCVCEKPTVRSIDVKGFSVTVCWSCERESEEYLLEKSREGEEA